MLHVVGVSLSASTTPFFPQPPPPPLQRRHGNRHSLLLSAGLESSARPRTGFLFLFFFFFFFATERSDVELIAVGGARSLTDEPGQKLSLSG